MRADRVRHFAVLVLFNVWCGVAAGMRKRPCAVSGRLPDRRPRGHPARVGALERRRGRNPDFDLIVRSCGDRAGPDAAVGDDRFARRLQAGRANARKEAAALLDLLDGVSWDACSIPQCARRRSPVGGDAGALHREGDRRPGTGRVSFSTRLAPPSSVGAKRGTSRGRVRNRGRARGGAEPCRRSDGICSTRSARRSSGAPRRGSSAC